jgi:adhesin transport system membrane fusion protein
VAVGTFGGTVAFVDPADDGMGKFRTLIFKDENVNWPDPNFLSQGVRVKGLGIA